MVRKIGDLIAVRALSYKQLKYSGAFDGEEMNTKFKIINIHSSKLSMSHSFESLI